MRLFIFDPVTPVLYDVTQYLYLMYGLSVTLATNIYIADLRNCAKL